MSVRVRPRYGYDKLATVCPLRPENRATHRLQSNYQTAIDCTQGIRLQLHFVSVDGTRSPVEVEAIGATYTTLADQLIDALVAAQPVDTNLYIEPSKVRFAILLEEELLTC